MLFHEGRGNCQYGTVLFVKILCTGDLHLGKAPTKLPESYDNDEKVQIAHVLKKMVDFAINEIVDIVLVSGDVIDQDNAFFESIGPLCRELKRMNDAGIEVFMVAGNHDWQALPSTLKVHDFEHVHLLGEEGIWQRKEIEIKGMDVSIFGWSFPQRTHESNPLEGLSTSGSDALKIGLLHCDLDKAESSYGPVSRSLLLSEDIDIWVLGHIHAPQRYDLGSGRIVLYPGTPQPRDPKESGPHGPYLITVEDDGDISVEGPLPLSTVRYENVSVIVPAEINEESLRTLITKEALATRSKIIADIGSGADDDMLISLRMSLLGDTNIHDRISKIKEDAEHEIQDGVFINSLSNDTAPLLNLSEMTGRNDAVGELARFLVSVQDGVDLRDDPLMKKIRDGFKGSTWKNAIGNPPSILDGINVYDEEDVIKRVERQAKVLLKGLIDSQEA
ncbi:MAG: DNA repair exonuclease [Methanomassiliicoccales archaeon]|nr:DNA repair exonuclease [Methanomassiliicoccales archaeon]